MTHPLLRISRHGLGLAIALVVAPNAFAATPMATPAGGAAMAQAPQAQRPSRQYAIADFVNTVGVFGASFSADESRLLFSSNKSGVWNTYSMPVAGGEWKAVTRSTTDNN